MCNNPGRDFGFALSGLVIGVVLMGLVVFLNSNTAMENTANLKSAFELNGYPTARIGPTTFTVFLNGTDDNNTFFVDCAQISNKRFIMANSAGQAKPVNFSDDTTLTYMTAVKRAIQSAQAM